MPHITPLSHALDELLAALKQFVLTVCQERNQPGQPPPDELLDIKEAARLLHTSRSWLYKKHGEERIPAVRIGGKLCFSQRSLEEWIQSREQRRLP